MGLLSSLLGGTSRRRGYSSGFGSAFGGSRRGYGRGRAASGGLLSSNLSRMALGGLAAYGARRFMNSRRQQPPVGPSAY
jgi:hypothetical protein